MNPLLTKELRRIEDELLKSGKITSTPMLSTFDITIAYLIALYDGTKDKIK